MIRKIFTLTMVVICCLLAVQAIGAKTVVRLYEVGGKKEVAATNANLKAFMKLHPDIKVEIARAPSGTDNALGLFLQLFESKSGDIDVLTIDSAWAKSLSSNLVDLNKYMSSEQKSDYYRNALESYLIDGKLVGAPFSLSIGLLFYRKDLLKKYDIDVPETWIDLTKAAYLIQNKEREKGNKDFDGFVWQGYAYEGLTCNALEWIYNYNGGVIIDKDKKITINNPNAIKALTMAAHWIGTISPKGVMEMREDETKNVFMSGNAAFVRSWPYLYAVCNIKGSAVNGKIGVAEIPKGSKGVHGGVMGGWAYGVNKYSKNIKAAAELAVYLGSKDAQKRRAEIAGQAPNLKSLYKEQLLPAENPVFNIMEKALNAGFNRPYTQAFPNYNKVSSEFYRMVYKILTKEKTSYAGLKELANKLKDITGYDIK